MTNTIFRGRYGLADVRPGGVMSDEARLQKLEAIKAAGALPYAERYERIAPHWDALPTPASKSCEEWSEARMQVAALLAHRGSCGPGATATHTLMERHRLHEQYVEELTQFVMPEFEAALVSTCTGNTRVTRLPRVCLSCMAPSLKPIID